jgi:ribonuclease Z
VPSRASPREDRWAGTTVRTAPPPNPATPEEAAQTATRGGVGTLVLTHYVPPIPTGGAGDDWRALAAEHFTGVVEIGDDLHRIEVHPTTGTPS